MEKQGHTESTEPKVDVKVKARKCFFKSPAAPPAPDQREELRSTARRGKSNKGNKGKSGNHGTEVDGPGELKVAGAIAVKQSQIKEIKE